jgi:hypothetical protein
MEFPFSSRATMDNIDTILRHRAFRYPQEMFTIDVNKRPEYIKLPRLPNLANTKYLAGSMFVKEDGTRGVASGSYDADRDYSLLHTARRQCEELFGYTPSTFAPQCIFSLDKSSEKERSFLVISFTFIIVDKPPFELQKPQHVCWKTEQQIEDDMEISEEVTQLHTFRAGSNIWNKARIGPRIMYHQVIRQFASVY